MQTSKTFYDIACIWKDNYLKKRTISTRVKEEYWDILNNRVFGKIGSINITEVDAFELDNLINDLMDRDYAAHTIRNTFAVVKSILAYAYKKGFIDTNPIDKMDDLPSQRNGSSIHFFTPSECKRFFEALDGEPLSTRTYFTILLYGGFRRGELCALKWDDVDFKHSSISINKALSRTHGGIIVKDPKTASSVRTISLPPCCFDMLLQLFKTRVSAYVFTNKDGSLPVNPQLQTNRFKRIMDRYNSTHAEKLPNIRLHDLRHTAATLLISNNVDVETVAKRLGHAKPSVTLNIYAHPTIEADYRASKVLEDLLK